MEQNEGNVTRDVIVSLTVRVGDDVDNEQLADRIQEALAPLGDAVRESGELQLRTAALADRLRPPNGYGHRLWEKVTC